MTPSQFFALRKPEAKGVPHKQEDNSCKDKFGRTAAKRSQIYDLGIVQDQQYRIKLKIKGKGEGLLNFGSWEWALIRGRRLFEAGCLINFHYFQ